MALPLVKRSANNNDRKTPDREAVKRLLDVAEFTPEGLSHVCDQNEQSGVLAPEMQTFIEGAVAIATSSRAIFEGKDVMGGEEPPTQFIALQEAYQSQALASLQQDGSANKSTTMSIDVKDDGTMLRGYSQDGKPLDSENASSRKTINNFDAMAKSWMAKQNIFYQDGKLFAANNKGEMKKNAKGEPVTFLPEDFRKVLRDPVEGMMAFMKKLGVNMQLDNATVKAQSAAAALPAAHQQAPASSQASVPEVKKQPEVRDTLASKSDPARKDGEAVIDTKEQAEASAESRPGKTAP